MCPEPGKALFKREADRRHRRYPRYRSEFPVTVTLLSGGEHLQLSAHCMDLAEAGIGVLIAADLNLGEVATLAFSIPGRPEPWDVRAVLRHRRGFHYGFEFLSLSEQQGKILLGFLPGLERADSD
jgi:PilZ domain-containing protein